MASNQTVNLEKLLEIQVEQKQLELAYAKEKLFFMRKEREVLEAVACVNDDLLQEEPQPNDASKAPLGEDILNETTEGFAVVNIDCHDILKLPTMATTPQHEGVALVTEILSRPDTDAKEADAALEDKKTCTTAEAPPQSLIIKFKLPTGSGHGRNIPSSSRKGTLLATDRVVKYPKKQNRFELTPRRGTASAIAEELKLELSELNSSNIDSIPKRKRPAAGVYIVDDCPTDSERQELLARFCNPIIQIFRDSLKGVASSNTRLSRDLNLLQMSLDKGTLNPDDGLCEWVNDMETILKNPALRTGMDRMMLVSKLQRWSEEWDELIYKCLYGPIDYLRRVDMVDHSVKILTREFASLSEGVIPIVRSDIV